MIELCEIEPEFFEGEDREKAKYEKMKEYLDRMRKIYTYDSGLTREQERKALIYAILRALA